ncbi:MAG: thiamine pyrophosphate-dependent enzyme [Desulfobacteraceae bacterium]
MNSFLNDSRPPVFCPGCTHERIIHSLDSALKKLGVPAHKTVIVSDIGCSGLFDTFFHVHALHGLHGRALTYASGLKLADPELNVIVTMGDGGLGIGGAHVLASCRRNLDLTLIVLNNFNFGMTGGQYSATTPTDAIVGSGFLNSAEMPVDICEIAESAGATWVNRCSGHDAGLDDRICEAVGHKGFSLIETLGMCTGRYTKRNQLTPKVIDGIIEEMPSKNGPVEKNLRPEYGERYRELAASQSSFPEPVFIDKRFDIGPHSRKDVMILGSAGMRIVTAGDIVCYAGMSAGLHVSVKNDYNITVLRGQSVSEILVSDEKIGYTGMTSPSIVIALSEEGVERRRSVFGKLDDSAFVLKAKGLSIPDTRAEVAEIDFKEYKIKKQDWALASLGYLAETGRLFRREMLEFAVRVRFSEKVADMALETTGKMRSV